MISIRVAKPEDAANLTRIAMQSKAHWGYSAEFMQAAQAELTVLPEDILDPDSHYRVAIHENKPIGFYALSMQAGNSIELDAMFVSPPVIGTGVGSMMIKHAKKVAAGLGAVILTIQSDPFALGFYQNAGGRITGESESESIPGRYLPTLEIPLG